MATRPVGASSDHGPQEPIPVGPIGERSFRGTQCTAEVTLGRYFRAFSPGPPWPELVRWPPDVFALANLVLDHTEAYRFAVAPPTARRWPPVSGWDEQVASAASAWRHTASTPGSPAPSQVMEQWQVVTRCRDVPMALIRSGEAWELCQALLTLHAMADEACQGLSAERKVQDRSFDHLAWAQLAATGSLSRISPARVRIVPKTHFAARGITIRSFSRYLALCYESVDLRWRRTEAADRWSAAHVDRREFNMVLVPWPLQVRASDFRPIEGPLDNMDREVFGFFEFAPEVALPPERLDCVLEAARKQMRRVDAVVLPEGALDVSEVEPLEEVLAAHRVTSLIAGVRERANDGDLGQNRLHVGIHSQAGWQHLGQAKHHRWCLDESQIRQYHLTRALDPKRQWWEGIDLPARRIEVIDMGGGATLAPLICEDLARLDEVADVLRRLGPTLVVALLLDGPQLATRWPWRYASVLADDPGSAVLTLTSLGMATRSRPPGCTRSRVVALWNDPKNGLRQLELGRRASALALTISCGTTTVWTADGRRHEDATPDLVLSGVHQIGTTTSPRRRSRHR